MRQACLCHGAVYIVVGKLSLNARPLCFARAYGMCCAALDCSGSELSAGENMGRKAELGLCGLQTRSGWCVGSALHGLMRHGHGCCEAEKHQARDVASLT
eukprot:XP_001699898.1 predicted protein [Chlamydomonas reinhardtii]